MSQVARRRLGKMLLGSLAIVLVGATAVVALQGFSAQTTSPGGGLRLAEGTPPALNTGMLLLRTLAVLGLLVAIIYLGAWGIRRLAGRNAPGAPSSKLQVLGSVFLGPKRALYAVHVLDRVLIVGVTEAQISLLSEIADPEKVAAFVGHTAKGPTGRPFASYLSSLLKGSHVAAS
ncbi:MAG: flagellar biosynthetic protein FliO [Calditrichaeota bacterium]|nr:flagellar biosynthetic protein FliO [Calditrichota bacterium]